MFEDLAGKVAVVTGGARGLGLSMGRALARQGVRVGLVDLLDDVHASAAALAEELGVESVGATADVTSADDVAAAFAHVSETPRKPVSAGQRRRHHGLGGQPRRHRGVVAPGDRHQPHGHVPLLPGAWPRLPRRRPRRRDRERLVDVGPGRQRAPAPDLVQRLQGRGRPADQVARRGMGRPRRARERHRAGLLPVRHDP